MMIGSPKSLHFPASLYLVVASSDKILNTERKAEVCWGFLRKSCFINIGVTTSSYLLFPYGAWDRINGVAAAKLQLWGRSQEGSRDVGLDIFELLKQLDCFSFSIVRSHSSAQATI